MRRLLTLLFITSLFSTLLINSTRADEATPQPSAPTLISPQNGAESAGPITFEWSVSAEQVESRLEIATTADFVEIRYSGQQAETSSTPVVVFDPGTTYVWRVWSIQDGQPVAVSETWYFTIRLEPMTTPTLNPDVTEIPTSATPEPTISPPGPTESAATATSSPVSTATATESPDLSATPTSKPAEPTPVTSSDLSGSWKRSGYTLKGVGRSSGSVHPNTVVDSDLGTIWTSPATQPDSAWFVLALDSVQPIGEIRWVLGKSGRADQIRISTSVDRSTWTEVGRSRNTSVGVWTALSVDREARYVRFIFVNIRGDRWLGGVVEVEALPPTANPEPTATKAPITPTPVADGIIRNASFEAGTSSWYLESGARVSSSTSRSGLRALAMTSSGGYADQRVTIQPGSSYALSVWGYLTRPYDVGMVGLVYRDANGKRLATLEPAPIELTQTSFSSAEIEFTIPSGVKTVNVYVWKQEGAAGFFADDIRLRKIKSPSISPRIDVGDQCQQLLVPGYFDPRSTMLWEQTTETGSGVGLVIVNPNSGADDDYDSVWAEVVADARAAGFTVLAYVQTDYGSRSSDAVIAEMNRYRSWYGVKDFFLDEAATGYSSVALYRKMVTNVHRGGGIAVLNFGWTPHPAFMEFTDIAGVFEDSHSVYNNSYHRPSWFGTYPPERFLHIIHSTPSSKWPAVIEQSRARNAGYVWVTDDDTVSYYKSLPTFWYALNEAVSKNC